MIIQIKVQQSFSRKKRIHNAIKLGQAKLDSSQQEVVSLSCNMATSRRFQLKGALIFAVLVLHLVLPAAAKFQGAAFGGSGGYPFNNCVGYMPGERVLQSEQDFAWTLWRPGRHTGT